MTTEEIIEAMNAAQAETDRLRDIIRHGLAKPPRAFFDLMYFVRRREAQSLERVARVPLRWRLF